MSGRLLKGVKPAPYRESELQERIIASRNGRGEAKAQQSLPSDTSIFIWLMEGKVGRQVAGKQVFGGPLSLIPLLFASPRPVLSYGRGSKAFVYTAVCKPLKKVICIYNNHL